MMACSSKPSVSTRIWRFFPLPFCPRHSHADRCRPPFFSALYALAIDDGGARAGFSLALLSTLHIKRVMDAIQRAVVAPQVEIVEQCAAWRQVFRDRTPLASRAQNIHNPVHHFAHLDMALVAAALGGRDQWFDMRPFIVGQVTRISQFAAVVPSAVLPRPHRWCPLESGHHFESQTIQRIQNVFGRTLRTQSRPGGALFESEPRRASLA